MKNDTLYLHRFRCLLLSGCLFVFSLSFGQKVPSNICCLDYTTLPCNEHERPSKFWKKNPYTNQTSKKRWYFYCFQARVLHVARAVVVVFPILWRQPMVISWQSISSCQHIFLLIAFIHHHHHIHGRVDCRFTHLLINQTINDVDIKIRFNRSIS